MREKNRNHYRYSLTLPAIVLYTLFYIIPVILGFVMAFTNWNIRDLRSAEFNGIENFITIFGDQNFLLSVKNTLLFAVTTTVFKVIFGLGLALLLTNAFKLRSFMRSVFYMPAVLSTVVIGLVFTAFFEVGGVFDRMVSFLHMNTHIWLGEAQTAMACVIFVEIWQWSGFSMMLFIAGLQGIDRIYYEAATIDGATKWQRLRYITIPLLGPSFTITIVTNLIGGLKVFDKVYVLTNGGPGYATQVLGTYVYRAFSAGFLGKSSAMSLVLTVLVCVITIIINKYMRGREVDA